jgi:FG-GAP-like repeat
VPPSNPFCELAPVPRNLLLMNKSMRIQGLANSARMALIPVAFGLISLASVAEAQIRTIVQTGDPSPNRGTFNGFGLPSLNNAGQVVFVASLNGVDTEIYRTVIPGPGATPVARPGDTAPGGGVFVDFAVLLGSSPLAMTSSGEIVFAAASQISQYTPQQNSIFGFSATGLGTRFTAAGTISPDGNGVLNALPTRSFVSNNNDQVAFIDSLTGSNNAGADDEGIFRAGNRGLAQIVREGAIVPDGNGRFGDSLGTGSFPFGPPILNDAGTVAFRAGVIDSNTEIPGYTSSFDSGLFLGNGGGVVQIARGGQTGIPGGGTFTFFSDPAINNNNQIAFSANYQLDTIVYTAIYRHDSGALKRIAYAGEALPGGGIINTAGGSVVINDAGQVASQIGTFTSGSYGSGIIRGSGGALTVIARNGQPTPRGSAGVTFYSFGGRVFAMNALGDVAFTALLSNGSIGLFLYGDQFGLLQIAEVGDVLNGSTITGLDLAGTTSASLISPLQTGLNDSDQVVFRFQLANSKGGIAVFSMPQPGVINLRTLALQWNIAGAGDFNGDGNADLVWENTSTGQRAIWFLKNGVLSSSIYLPTVGVQWRIAGVGDFNGDGNADLVWQNISTGQRAIWFLKNGVLSSTINLPSVGVQWRIAGAGDFNGDGNADLVWENTSTGQRAVWFLKNGVLASTINLPTIAIQWHIVGVGDFDSDGNPDLVWENTSTGQRAIWFLKNGVLSSTINLSTTAVAWHIAGAGDFNDNGFADLVWENTSTGQRVIWLLKNGVPSAN